MTDILVTIKGPMFEKKIEQVVKDAIIGEAILKIGQRMERGGRGLGAKRNDITQRFDGLDADVFSTRRFPRTRGRAWTRKNMAIGNAMAPRVLRSVSKRIVSEMGG